jgi:hypothetical protein
LRERPLSYDASYCCRERRREVDDKVEQAERIEKAKYIDYALLSSPVRTTLVLVSGLWETERRD